MTKKEIEELQDVEYKLTDDQGKLLGDLSLLAIVDDPAIKEDFKMFASEESNYQFAAANDDQRLIIGPAMVVNKRIPRKPSANVPVPHNAWFSEETVRMCSELFLKNSNHTKTNLNHNEIATSSQMADCFASQSWIVNDPKMDTACSYGFTPQKGDWYVAFKIDSPKVWNYLKESGIFNGFSIEGKFTEKFCAIIKDKEEHFKTQMKGILYNPLITDKEKEDKIKEILKIK